MFELNFPDFGSKEIWGPKAMVRLHRIGFRVEGAGLRAWDFQISAHFEGCPSMVSFRVLVLTIHTRTGPLVT